MVFMIIGLIKTQFALRLFLKIVFLAIETSVLFSIYYYIKASQHLSYARTAGLAGDPNEFAIYTVTGLCIGYYLFRRSRKKTEKIIYLTSIAISILSLIFSGSRGGILALSAVVVFVVVIDFRKSIKPFFLGICLIVMIGFIALPIIPNYQISRIMGIPKSIIYGEKTVSLRYELWKSSLRVWMDYPLFGVGSGGVTDYKMEHMLYKNIDINYVTHNTYINILAEMGITGFFIFVGIIMFSIVGYYRSMQQFRKTDLGLYRITVLFSAILVCWLTACISLNLQHNRYLWMAIAMGLVMRNMATVGNQKLQK
jgi:O-antigen ligase